MSQADREKINNLNSKLNAKIIELGVESTIEGLENTINEVLGTFDELLLK